MQSQSKILEDIAKVASSALGVAAGMRSEVEARFREQLERLLTQMDLVPREEFDAMKAVAVAAREGQEALAAQVAALEQRLAALEAGQGKAAQGKAAPKAAKPAAKPTAMPAGGHGETPEGDG
jgi:hypothetical protein